MSGIMYKNRPYAGGGGAGGASALSDLTDTSISSPTNGQVLKYNNGFWENDDESGGTTVVANPTGTASAQLNKLQVGNDIYSIPSGGGGGSSITYGYINPSDAASDGDVYYLLDANDKKKGLFLYMNNSWTLIEGTPYYPEFVLYDEGTEEVAWSVYEGATKESNYITMQTGGGFFTSYCALTNALNLSNYDILNVKFDFRGTLYEQTIDISSYTGNQYIMFMYETDGSGNEAAIAINNTVSVANRITLQRITGVVTNSCKLYYMSLS